MKHEKRITPLRACAQGLGTLLSFADFGGKIRLINRLGGIVGYFVPRADCCPVKGARVTISFSDRIGRLMWAGSYERELLNLLKGFLKPGMVFVDVGAQIGYFSVAAAVLVGESGHVYSFEPDPDCFSQLTRNRESYPWIKTHNAAVADFTGQTFFYRTPHQAESGWGALFSSDEKRSEISVPVCSLDSWAATNQISKIDFLKVDVEGAECRVIAGARNVLEKTRPLVWLEANEVCLSRDSKSVPLLLQLIVDLEYAPYRFGTGSLPSLANIVAVPRERTDISSSISRQGLRPLNWYEIAGGSALTGPTPSP